MANDDASIPSFFQRVPAELLTQIAIAPAKSAAELTLTQQRCGNNTVQRSRACKGANKRR